VEAAIKSPGVRDSAWFWVILALAVDFGAIAAAYFGRTLEVPVVLWIIAGIVLLAGLSYTRVAVRSLRLLQEGPWEIWPAAVLTVDHFAGSEGGKSSVLMLFDFRTGGRHILRVASIGQAREVVDIDGEIWFRGDPERGGVICVPGAEKPYVALPRPLFSSRDGAGLRDRFDTQWPPGNPADWPPPHEPFKRDWPGAPKGYLSDPWDN
jgi:hypothetical protein